MFGDTLQIHISTKFIYKVFIPGNEDTPERCICKAWIGHVNIESENMTSTSLQIDIKESKPIIFPNQLSWLCSNADKWP